MHDDMVERVGRAVDKVLSENFIGIDDPNNWPDFIPSVARAAIEAMREPTEAMVSAGAWNFGDLDIEFASLEASRWAFECWRDMIDAALTQKDAANAR